MFRRTVLTLFTVLMLLTSFLALDIKFAFAVTITVPDQYSTIQGAVDAAMAGDTVFVRSGTYYTHVIIDKTISLIGESKTTTTINGNGKIDVSDAAILGFNWQKHVQL